MRALALPALLAVLAVLAVLALAPLGCTLALDPGRHQGGDAAVGPPPVPASDFCDEAVTAMCRARIACCSTAGAEVLADCVRARVADCESGVGMIVRDPITAYDPAIGRELIDEATAFADRCDAGEALTWLDSRSGVTRALRGTLGSGIRCDPIGMEGGAARFLACTYPEVCLVAGFNVWECGPQRARDATCWNDGECVDPLRCTAGGLMVGNCIARLPDGEACMRASECSSRFCRDSSACATPTADDVYCTDFFRGR